MAKQMSLDEINKARETIALCESYQRLFASEDGKVVLSDLKKRGFVVESSYSPRNPPEMVVFNEGRRSMVLHVLHMLLDSTRDDLVRRIAGTQENREQGESHNA